jgi:hypothetical protein
MVFKAMAFSQFNKGERSSKKNRDPKMEPWGFCHVSILERWGGTHKSLRLGNWLGWENMHVGSWKPREGLVLDRREGQVCQEWLGVTGPERGPGASAVEVSGRQEIPGKMSSLIQSTLELFFLL